MVLIAKFILSAPFERYSLSNDDFIIQSIEKRNRGKFIELCNHIAVCFSNNGNCPKGSRCPPLP